MRLKALFAAGVVAAVAVSGVAIASHVTQVDPATVPVGFLAAHSKVADVPISAFARAAAAKGADVTIQHFRLGPGAMTAWHTHPGPAIVTVVGGSLTYRDAHAGRCRDVTYTAGMGFVDPGFGHVHRAIAGPTGADFYAVYVLPAGSQQHLIPTAPLPECPA